MCINFFNSKIKFFNIIWFPTGLPKSWGLKSSVDHGAGFGGFGFCSKKSSF
jgi:hypothetical protein